MCKATGVLIDRPDRTEGVAAMLPSCNVALLNRLPIAEISTGRLRVASFGTPSIMFNLRRNPQERPTEAN